jgi:hypothetical protein
LVLTSKCKADAASRVHEKPSIRADSTENARIAGVLVQSRHCSPRTASNASFAVP